MFTVAYRINNVNTGKIVYINLNYLSAPLYNLPG